LKQSRNDLFASLDRLALRKGPGSIGRVPAPALEATVVNAIRRRLQTDRTRREPDLLR
jgi:hypothetical protein